MKKIIFLDFEGVLRRAASISSHFDQGCLELFESVVRSFPDSMIVITSTWRLGMSIESIRNLFSPDVAAQIIGITPDNIEEETYLRHAEIMTFREKNNMKELPWVAIDDDPGYFPKGSPVILTDPRKGFDIECAAQLIQMLRSSS